MHEPSSVPTDFDGWMRLADLDSEAFEQARRQVIESELAKAPPRLRAQLERLQWRIDMERKLHKNPMGSCIRLFEMMWDQVYGRNGLVEALTAESLPRSPSHSAEILCFERNPRNRI